MGDQAKPVLSTDKIDALLQGDTEVEHGRYASIAPTRAQTQTIPQPEFTEVEAADHAWRQTNHIWSNDELDKVSIEKHEPVTVSDHFMKGVMNVVSRLQFRHWLRPCGPVAAVRRVALNYPRVLRRSPRFRGGRLPPLLLSTHAKARPRRHLHFLRGSRERAHAPARLPQDVRSKPDHESALRGRPIWYDAVSGLDVRGPSGFDAPLRGVLGRDAVETYTNLVDK